MMYDDEMDNSAIDSEDNDNSNSSGDEDGPAAATPGSFAAELARRAQRAAGSSSCPSTPPSSTPRGRSPAIHPSKQGSAGRRGTSADSGGSGSHFASELALKAKNRRKTNTPVSPSLSKTLVSPPKLSIPSSNNGDTQNWSSSATQLFADPPVVDNSNNSVEVTKNSFEVTKKNVEVRINAPTLPLQELNQQQLQVFDQQDSQVPLETILSCDSAEMSNVSDLECSSGTGPVLTMDSALADVAPTHSVKNESTLAPNKEHTFAPNSALVSNPTVGHDFEMTDVDLLGESNHVPSVPSLSDQKQELSREQPVNQIKQETEMDLLGTNLYTKNQGTRVIFQDDNITSKPDEISNLKLSETTTLEPMPDHPTHPGIHVPGLKAVSGLARRVGGGRKSPTDEDQHEESAVEGDVTNINQRAGQLLGFANRALRSRVSTAPAIKQDEDLNLSVEGAQKEETLDKTVAVAPLDRTATTAAAAALAARQVAAQRFGGFANRLRHVAEQRVQRLDDEAPKEELNPLSFSPTKNLASARAAMTEYAFKHAKEEEDAAAKQHQLQAQPETTVPSEPELSLNAGAFFNRFRNKSTIPTLSSHGNSQHGPEEPTKRNSISTPTRTPPAPLLELSFLTLDETPHSKSLTWEGWSHYPPNNSFQTLLGLEVQHPFAQLILDKNKTMDVRRYDLPPALLNTPIIILESKVGKALQSGLPHILNGRDAITNARIHLVGICTVVSVKRFTSGGQFHADYSLHCVSADSEYGWMEGYTKELYGWNLDNIAALSDQILPNLALIRRMRSLFEVRFASNDDYQAIVSQMKPITTTTTSEEFREEITIESLVEMPGETPVVIESDVMEEEGQFLHSSPSPEQEHPKQTIAALTPPSEAKLTNSTDTSHNLETATKNLVSTDKPNGPDENSTILSVSQELMPEIIQNVVSNTNRAASPSGARANLSMTTTSPTQAEKSSFALVAELQRQLEQQRKQHDQDIKRREEQQSQVIAQLRDALEKAQGNVTSLTQSNSHLSSKCQTLEKEVTKRGSLLDELQTSFSNQLQQCGELSHEKKSLVERLTKLEAALKAEQSAHRFTKEELDLSKASHISEVESFKAQEDKLQHEIARLRKQVDFRQGHEATTISRLNESKKMEAIKTREVSALQTELNDLRPKYMAVTRERDKAVEERDALTSTLDKLKSKCVERVRVAEEALEKELELNEERKRKMKEYVTAKADELRRAKELSDALLLELEEIRRHYKSTREQLEESNNIIKQKDNTIDSLRQELNRLKTQSDSLHKMGDTLESQLTKSAREKEEHKHKRIEAKQELMSLLRRLESEQKVSKELKESLKFKFTPKTLSQQQQLSDGLEELEGAMLRLSRRFGKSLPPRPEVATSTGEEGDREMTRLASADERPTRKNKSSSGKNIEWDYAKLIEAMEEEQENVDKCIATLLDSLDRLNQLLADDSRSCISSLAEILTRIAAGGPPLVPASTHGRPVARSRRSPRDAYGRLPFNADTSIL